MLIYDTYLGRRYDYFRWRDLEATPERGSVRYPIRGSQKANIWAFAVSNFPSLCFCYPLSTQIRYDVDFRSLILD